MTNTTYKFESFTFKSGFVETIEYFSMMRSTFLRRLSVRNLSIKQAAVASKLVDFLEAIHNGYQLVPQSSTPFDNRPALFYLKPLQMSYRFLKFECNPQ